MIRKLFKKKKFNTDIQQLALNSKFRKILVFKNKLAVQEKKI